MPIGSGYSMDIASLKSPPPGTPSSWQPESGAPVCSFQGALSCPSRGLYSIVLQYLSVGIIYHMLYRMREGCTRKASNVCWLNGLIELKEDWVDENI